MADVSPDQMDFCIMFHGDNGRHFVHGFMDEQAAKSDAAVRTAKLKAMGLPGEYVVEAGPRSSHAATRAAALSGGIMRTYFIAAIHLRNHDDKRNMDIRELLNRYLLRSDEIIGLTELDVDQSLTTHDGYLTIVRDS